MVVMVLVVVFLWRGRVVLVLVLLLFRGWVRGGRGGVLRRACSSRVTWGEYEWGGSVGVEVMSKFGMRRGVVNSYRG